MEIKWTVNDNGHNYILTGKLLCGLDASTFYSKKSLFPSITKYMAIKRIEKELKSLVKIKNKI